MTSLDPQNELDAMLDGLGNKAQQIDTAAWLRELVGNTCEPDDGTPPDDAPPMSEEEITSLLTGPLGIGRGPADVEEVINEFNGRYMVVNEAGKAIIYEPVFDEILKRRFFNRISFDDLSKLYLNRKVQVKNEKDKLVWKGVAGVWLNHRRRRQYIGGVRFSPGGKVPHDVLNLWEGFAVQPRQGEWFLMRQHIEDNICSGNADHADYLLKWIARMLQRPEVPGEVAVVLRSGKGTGKGTLAKAILRMLGHHSIHISNPGHLIGNFNAHLRDAIFLFADEAFFAGDKKHVGVLNALVTEPLITIEGKYQNAIQSPNFLHILMASNEDWVVPASSDERRYFMPKVSEGRKQNHAYFEALARQMENGGYEAMLHDLLAMDLTEFNVRAVPSTEGLEAQKKLSLPPTERWWQECLMRGYVFRSKLGLEEHFAVWMEDVSTELLYASYMDFAQSTRVQHPISRETLGRFMKRVEGESKRFSKDAVGEHMTDEPDVYGGFKRKAKVVFGDRPMGYSLGALNLAREAFDKAIGATTEWGEDNAKDAY